MSDENMDEDDEDYEPKPYEHDGNNIFQVWDDDEHNWIVTEPWNQEDGWTCPKTMVNLLKNDD